MPRTVGVLFSLSILFTTKTWRAFMSAFLHGQPSFRAVFFRLQVVLHEQDCIQIKTIGQWPVFELQSTKNIFEYSLKNIRKTHHLNFTSFTTCRAIIFVLFASISAKWELYAFTEPSLAANHEYLQKFLSLYTFLHWGQKPCLNTNCLRVSIETDLTLAVPVSDHAWQQTMCKASR